MNNVTELKNKQQQKKTHFTYLIKVYFFYWKINFYFNSKISVQIPQRVTKATKINQHFIWGQKKKDLFNMLKSSAKQEFISMRAYFFLLFIYIYF